MKNLSRKGKRTFLFKSESRPISFVLFVKPYRSSAKALSGKNRLGKALGIKLPLPVSRTINALPRYRTEPFEGGEKPK